MPQHRLRRAAGVGGSGALAAFRRVLAGRALVGAHRRCQARPGRDAAAAQSAW